DDTAPPATSIRYRTRSSRRLHARNNNNNQTKKVNNAQHTQQQPAPTTGETTQVQNIAEIPLDTAEIVFLVVDYLQGLGYGQAAQAVEQAVGGLLGHRVDWQGNRSAVTVAQLQRQFQDILKGQGADAG